MKLLADNDALCFLNCSAIEKVTYELRENGELREEFPTLSEARKALSEVDDSDTHEITVKQVPFSLAYNLQNYHKMIDKVMSETGCNEIRLYSEKPKSQTFRHELAFTEPYKSGRDNPWYPRPLLLNELKQWCVENLDAIELSSIETDDALCIVQTEHMKRGLETTIAQNDKDILQCQGRHYRLHSKHRDIVDVEGYGWIELKKDKVVGTGSKFFFTQVLTGDKTDTYSGLPNFGPKKTLEVLEPTTCYEEGLEATIQAYKDVYANDWEKHLLEQARLAFMLRDYLIDGEIKMWDLDYRPYYG